MNFSCAQKAKIVFKSIHQITLSISLWFVVCDFRAVLLGSAKISIFPKHTHFTFPFFGSSQEKRDWVSMWGITYSSEDAKQFFSLLKSARPMTSFLFLTVSKNRKLKSCVFYFLYPFAKQQWIKHSKITRHIYVWIVLGGWVIALFGRYVWGLEHHVIPSISSGQPPSKNGFQFHKRVIVRPPHSLVNKYLFFSDCAAWILEHIWGHR